VKPTTVEIEKKTGSPDKKTKDSRRSKALRILQNGLTCQSSSQQARLRFGKNTGGAARDTRKRITLYESRTRGLSTGW